MHRHGSIVREIWEDVYRGIEEGVGLHMQKLEVIYGGHICRRCLDRHYKVHLSHRDVKEIAGNCPCCGKESLNLVVGLKIGGRLKMLGKW